MAQSRRRPVGLETKHLGYANAFPQASHFGSIRSARRCLLLPQADSDHGLSQALQLLNNKFVTRQAAIFADRIRNEIGTDPRRQVERAFLLTVSRLPKDEELNLSLQFLASQEEYHRAHNSRLREQAVDPAEIRDPVKQALTDLCHGLFNTNEFIYIN